MTVGIRCLPRFLRDFNGRYYSIPQSRETTQHSGETNENGASQRPLSTSHTDVNFQFPCWLAALTLGFHFLPRYSSLLYITSHSRVLGNTCTTAEEWSWIFVASLVVLFVPHVHLQSPKLPWRYCCFKLTLTRMNILWFVAACMGPLIWEWMESRNLFSSSNYSNAIVMWVNYLGAKAAWPAYWNFGLIVLLPIHEHASCPNVPSLLDLFIRSPTGHSNGQRPGIDDDLRIKTKTGLRQTHTRASAWVAFWLSVHAVFIAIAYAVRLGTFSSFFETMLPMVLRINGVYRVFYTEGVVQFEGWIGCGMLLLLWITASSSSGIRKNHFEVAQIFHILSAVGFLLFSNMHDYNTLMFAWPALASLLADRLWKGTSSNRPSKLVVRSDTSQDNDADRLLQSTEKVRFSVKTFPSSTDLVELTIACPVSNGEADDLQIEYHYTRQWPLRYVYAGAHFLIKDRSISPWQFHPISISAIDSQNARCTFHVKDLGDWSTAFVEKWIQRVGNVRDGNDDAILEYLGPFGPDLSKLLTSPYSDNRSYVFVAGGIGVTGLSAMIQQCLQRNLTFSVIWSTRSRSEMLALGKELFWNRQIKIDSAAMVGTGPNRPSSESRIPKFQVYITSIESAESISPLEECNTDFLWCSTIDAETRHFEAELRTDSASSLKSGSLARIAVVMVGMALSFLLARQLCCTQASISNDPDDSNFNQVTLTCGMASTSTIRRCRPCDDRDDIRNTASSPLGCCTATICHWCFRGLPIILILVMTPLFVYIHSRILELLCWLRLHFRSPVPEINQPASGSTYSREATGGEGAPFSPLLHIDETKVVSGCRPDMRQLLSEILADCAFQHGPTTVLVCGPDSLGETVKADLDFLIHDTTSAEERKVVSLLVL